MRSEEQAANAARYLWLKARYLAADFAYGDPSEACCALVFEIPEDMSVSADLDSTIDEAPGNAGIRASLSTPPDIPKGAVGVKDALDDAFECARAAMVHALDLTATRHVLETLRCRVDAALSAAPVSSEPAAHDHEWRAHPVTKAMICRYCGIDRPASHPAEAVSDEALLTAATRWSAGGSDADYFAEIRRAILALAGTQAAAEPAGWREALKFYAERDHFMIANEDAWDTVSGEPQNFWCDEEGTATVEDGTVAAMALRGTPIATPSEAAAVEPAAQSEGSTVQMIDVPDFGSPPFGVTTNMSQEELWRYACLVGYRTALAAQPPAPQASKDSK